MLLLLSQKQREVAWRCGLECFAGLFLLLFTTFDTHSYYGRFFFLYGDTYNKDLYGRNALQAYMVLGLLECQNQLWKNWWAGSLNNPVFFSATASQCEVFYALYFQKSPFSKKGDFQKKVFFKITTFKKGDFQNHHFQIRRFSKSPFSKEVILRITGNSENHRKFLKITGDSENHRTT